MSLLPLKKIDWPSFILHFVDYNFGFIDVFSAKAVGAFKFDSLEADFPAF